MVAVMGRSASLVALLAAMAACGRFAFDSSDPQIGNIPPMGDAPPIGDGPPPSIARSQVLRPPGVQGTSVATAITFTPGTVVVAIPYWNEAARTVVVADTAGHSWTAMPAQAIPTGC